MSEKYTFSVMQGKDFRTHVRKDLNILERTKHKQEKVWKLLEGTQVRQSLKSGTQVREPFECSWMQVRYAGTDISEGLKFAGTLVS